MKKNDRGYSLVELIVAIAIFAVVGIAVFGFMTYSSNNYRRTNTDIKLQYEQQLAVNQVRDLIVESTSAIYFDESSKTLAIYSLGTSDAGNVVYPVTKVAFDAAEKKLYFGKKTFDTKDSISYAAITDTQLLAENVDSFEVDLSKVKRDKVTFKITFLVQDKSQEVTEVVALRNRLLVSNETDKIYSGDSTEVNSFIKDISIYRGTKKFDKGATDEIGKTDTAVSVKYKAVVTASEESEREYAVTWKLTDAPTGVTMTNGIVTVSPGVEVGREFRLSAVSVDDPKKEASITIRITGNGVYPVSASLALDSIKDENGYREYNMKATLTYTNATSDSDPALFDWKMPEKMPAGATFNEKTGVLTVTSQANGCHFDIYVVAKETNAQGEKVISNTLAIDVTDVPEYSVGPSIKVSVMSKLQRNGYVTPTVTFRNATHSSYTYTWEIEPADSDWGKAEKNSSFDLVSFSSSLTYDESSVKHMVETGTSGRTATICCSKKLNWKGTYRFILNVTATDTKTGEVLTADPQYILIGPVTATLSPVTYTPGKNQTSPYPQEQLEKLTTGAYLTKSDNYRWFDVQFEYLDTDTIGWPYTLNHQYKYFNAEGLLASGQGLRTIGDDNWRGWTAFVADLNVMKTANRPTKINYVLEISDPYGNSVLTDTRTYYVDYDAE